MRQKRAVRRSRISHAPPGRPTRSSRRCPCTARAGEPPGAGSCRPPPPAAPPARCHCRRRRRRPPAPCGEGHRSLGLRMQCPVMPLLLHDREKLATHRSPSCCRVRQGSRGGGGGGAHVRWGHVSRAQVTARWHFMARCCTATRWNDAAMSARTCATTSWWIAHQQCRQLPPAGRSHTSAAQPACSRTLNTLTLVLGAPRHIGSGSIFSPRRQ